jgi:drug/metabolite transporter (DMT)-like permease
MKLGNKALAMVTLTVLLQLVAAALLKRAAVAAPLGLLLPAVLIAVTLGIHAVRFLLWGYVHRRWPLSHTYPMTAVFFPLILIMAAAYGEPIHLNQVLGGLLIAGGVAWLTLKTAE